MTIEYDYIYYNIFYYIYIYILCVYYIYIYIVYYIYIYILYCILYYIILYYLRRWIYKVDFFYINPQSVGDGHSCHPNISIVG